MAQAGAVLGLAVTGVEVEDIGCTSKTLADFPGMWQQLLSPASPVSASPVSASPVSASALPASPTPAAE